jgi:excisionase family DNA binding protein
MKTTRRITRKPPKPPIQRPANWEDIPILVDPAYLCMVLGLNYETIRRKLSRGEIKGKKIGRAWRIRRDDLREYIEL